MNKYDTELIQRADEIVLELDGYPEREKLIILCGALCVMMAEGADTVDHLLDTITTFKKMIEGGAKAQWFATKGNRH